MRNVLDGVKTMKIKDLTNGLCQEKIRSYDGKLIPGDSIEKKITKPNLLLHSCCGPCSSSVIERLVCEFNITVFFYNPCISDEDEYRKRRDSQIKLIEEFNRELNGMQSVKYIDARQITFREGPYEPLAFLKMTEGHEKDQEGGARCSLCFRQRLKKTAELALITSCDYFGTTLTVSPHKNYEIISGIGKELAIQYGLSFLDRDFKKQNGFKRSIELSKKYDLYRQNYCGCIYSER